MFLKDLMRASTILGQGICAGPVEVRTYPVANYVMGAGYEDPPDGCEPEPALVQGYVCGLETEDFDNSCQDSEVSKLVILNCPKIDFECACFKMTCGPYEGFEFRIFRNGNKTYIKRDEMNLCVEIAVIVSKQA